MNGKKLALVLGLIALVIAIPAAYVLAHPGGYYSVAEQQYQDEDWYQEMEQYMEERWDNQDYYGRMGGYGGYGGCHGWGR